MSDLIKQRENEKQTAEFAQNVSNKDLISRKAAIEALWSLDAELRPSAIDAILNMLNGLPSAKPEQQWIPVSERFPEDWVPVLVTLKRPERLPSWIKATPENYYHIVDADVCENGKWSVNGKNVLAWMPLPEPYREEGEK